MRKGRGARNEEILWKIHAATTSSGEKQLKEQCHITLSFLGLYDYVATKIEVYNEDTGKHETFSLLEEGELRFTYNEEQEMADEYVDVLERQI